jgi:GNAT superfamily N-acetyltransferase
MFKEATIGDVPTLCVWMNNLVEHVQQSSQDVYACNLKQEFFDSIEDWFKRSIVSDDRKILIAVERDKPVGFIMGGITAPYIHASKIEKIGMIELCWVEPEHRKQGYSRRLVDELEKWFRSKSIEYADVSYLNGNTEAEKTWSALGYAPFRTESRKKL